MRDLFQSPGFWAFMTTLVGSARWLMRVVYLYRKKNIEEKARLSVSVEKMKMDNAIRIATALKETVERITPIVLKHESVVSELDRSVKTVADIEQKMTEMMAQLKAQYDNFQTRMTQVQEGGRLVMDKVRAIETEIIEFKSGNIFVKTKK